jgi:hypothetical protein
MVGDEFNHFRRCARNDWHPIFIELNVLVSRFGQQKGISSAAMGDFLI